MSTVRAARPLFEVRTSVIHGKGVFALRAIPKGRRIVEYVGQRIGHEEAAERYDDDRMGRHHTFLFTVDETAVIDAAVDGNDARFINHSCRPNCEAVSQRGRIFIEALRSIRPGEEITYDYNMEREGRVRAYWRTLYACECGASSCRGTLLAPRKVRKKGKPAPKPKKER